MKDILCLVKKDIEIQPCQDLDLGLLNASQLLLQAEPLELWQYGIYLKLDTVRFSGWISLRLDFS